MADSLNVGEAAPAVVRQPPDCGVPGLLATSLADTL